MKTLHLTLKKKWFDLILSGEKVEEYRETKLYWDRRFLDEDNSIRKYDYVIFKNGYSKIAPTIKVEIKNIELNKGKEEWGAEINKEYYVIYLGKILEVSNIKSKWDVLIGSKLDEPLKSWD